MKNKGFTLIEMVIVIAVLGILAGIAVPRFMNSNAAARGAKIIADMRSIDSAASIYMARTGIVPTSLDQLTMYDGSSNPPKYPLIAVNSTPDGTDFIVKKNNGKEVEYKVAAGTAYVLYNGRATYDGTTKNVEWYLLDDALTSMLTGIREWQNNPTYSGLSYWEAQKKLWETNPELIIKMSQEEVEALLGNGIDVSFDNYRNWQNASDKGNLFLTSTTTVMVDGTMGDIQILRPSRTDPNLLGSYTAPVMIVQGEIYAMVDSSNKLIACGTGFGNGSVTFPVTDTRPLSTAELIGHLNPTYGPGHGWTNAAQEYAWLKGALVQAGYTKVN